ncbi:Protein disulfide-isomerase-like protein EhSep2 [Durusdinium trenchii]|uniref:Protein disulfide-isomerase-like protein EhSep2 n=1 Tax=Durusdinium trenchii TaxID=1381693 RepID=A0ABP0M5B8_9DINO
MAWRLLCVSLAIGHAASMELVSENFDDAIQSAQKNAFVLFCSDFCPWCKNYLNATWTSLMQKHKGSKEVLVAHIDCGSPAYEMGELRSPGTVTSACKRYGVDPICDKEEGHIPTIKYYDVSEEKWRRYKKGWEEVRRQAAVAGVRAGQDTLEGFIGDRLRPACNVKTAEHYVTRKNRDLRGEDLNFVHKHEAAPQKELERLQKMLTSGSFNVELLGPSVQRFFVVLLAGRGL